MKNLIEHLSTLASTILGVIIIHSNILTINSQYYLDKKFNHSKKEIKG